MSLQGRRRLRVFLIEFGFFALATAWFLYTIRESWDSHGKGWAQFARGARFTVGVIAGPMAGAIARPSHSGCLEYSWTLFPWCAAILGASIAVQFLRLRAGRLVDAIRLVAWTLGWFAWFGGAIASLLHAME